MAQDDLARLDAHGSDGKGRGADLLQTMDARVWAAEFCRVTGFKDEEWALTWFANAIMCGWDHRTWQTPEYKAQVAAALASPTEPPR